MTFVLMIQLKSFLRVEVSKGNDNKTIIEKNKVRERRHRVIEIYIHVKITMFHSNTVNYPKSVTS